MIECSGKPGDIALDEIVLIPNRRCSPVSQFGDLVTHYCDFETDTCDYTIEPADADVKWQRSLPQQVFPGLYESPWTDNTLQTTNGYFMRLTVKLAHFFLFV